MSIPIIKLEDAIKNMSMVSYVMLKGWEYFDRRSGRDISWLPSKVVVDRFKLIIGDKWSPVSADFWGDSLKDTNIVIDGHWIMARGGLCPGGVKLFEVEDIADLEEFIKEKLK